MTALRRVQLTQDRHARRYPRWKKALQWVIMFLTVGGWIPVAMAWKRFFGD